jgi:integrase
MFQPPSLGAPAFASSERPPAWFAGALLAEGSDAATLTDLDRRFEDFCEYALTSLGHSPASITAYRGVYRMFRRFLLEAGRPLRESIFAIEEWSAWVRKRGVTATTVNSYWRSLRIFFNDLERRDGIPNPFEKLRAPALPARIPKAYSAKDCARILTAAENIPWASEYDRVLAVGIFGTMLYAGLRRGEILKLTFVDVDLDAGTIRVMRGKGRAGGKDRTGYFGPELRQILQRFVAQRHRQRIEGPGFFASKATGRAISLSTLRRIHQRVRAASGVRFSLHALRHSFVTMLLSSGVPLHVAQELAGHANITTTAGYLRVWDEDKRREIQKISYRNTRFS